jgi:ABC-type polysaccharide/polyol phosphate export permease
MEIVLQIIYYITPIMYRPDAFKKNEQLSRLIAYNPLTSVLELIRRPLLMGEYPEPFHAVMALGFLCVVATIAWVLLRKFERNLVFWV